MAGGRRASYLALTASMLIFGTIGIFRKYIPCSSGLIACARGFLGAFSLIIYMKLRKTPVFKGIGRKNALLLMLSGAFIGVNWILLFEAYNYTSVAVATLCYYMQPTIVILLAPLIFRERLTVRKLSCACVSLFGMVLVSGLIDGGGAGDIRGVLLALGSALFYSSVVILNKLIHMENAYQKTVLQLLSAAVVLLPYILLTGRGGQEISAVSVIMLLIVGIFHTGFAYALYFGSMGRLSAQSVAVMSYIDPASALILSAVILGERLTVYGIIGAVMIIGAALISEMDFRRD